MRTPIGIHIRRKRKAIGLSQVALAQALGISASYLNLIENNKRSIGGKLMLRISERLGIDMAYLSGDSEARMIGTIRELIADPVMKDVDVEQLDMSGLVARFPEAAIMLTRLYRAYMDATSEIQIFQHRLESDPLLSQFLHQMLNRIAGMKSGAEILVNIPDLTDEERNQFIATINGEVQELAPVAQGLVAYFDHAKARRKPVSPITEVDEALIARNNHFPELEDVADLLCREIAWRNQSLNVALTDALDKRFGIACSEIVHAEPSRKRHRYDAEDRVFWFSSAVAPATKTFQMARLFAEQAAFSAIGEVTATLELSSDEARLLAQRALSSYVAGAMMMPYDRILNDAEESRYDIDFLTHRHGASFEQVAHRFTTLRRKSAEGVPFGFLRADRSGRLTKRFPLPGLTLPSAGHGCLLWPIYRAFSGSEVVRQISEFPGGERFLLFAKAVSKDGARYNAKPPTFSLMLACSLLHADRIIYSAGIDLFHKPVPVGPSCMLCSRQQCEHRQEAPL